MRQNSSSATRQHFSDFMTDPFAQAILTGALTLIPAQNYPTWLRRSLIWGPTIAGGAGAAYLATNPRVRRKLSARLAIAAHSDPSTRNSLRPQEPPSTILLKGNRSTASMVVIGTAVGGVVSLAMAGGFWADEKIDRGLRRLNIPFPRAVMGIAAVAVTWWQLKCDENSTARRNT